MFSINDFISKYENYNDEELINIHNNIDGYSIEAKEALNIIIERKGGMERLLKTLAEKKILTDEIKRIAKETAELGGQGIDSEFIKKTTTSTILSAEKVNEIVDQKFILVESELLDKKVTTRTIVGCFIGGAFASIIGGVLWGLQMIYSHRIFYLLLIGLALFCYWIIRLSTKQTTKNKFVLIATVISFILALIIGQLLLNIIGFQE